MSIYSDLVIADQAQAYWNLDESSSGSGSTVADISTHGYTGSNHVSPGAGGGAAFSGAVRSWQCNGAGYIAVPSGGTLAHGGGSFSYEAWIKPIASAYGGSAVPGRDVMAVTGSHTLEETVLNWRWDADAGAGTLRIKNRAEGYIVGVALATTPDLRDTWHHVVATWDGTSVALYLDGQPLTIDPAITESQIAALGNPFSAVSALLACGWDGVNAWSGDLDEVSIYGYALTPCQVQSHYDAATTGTFTPCYDWITLRHKDTETICWEHNGVTYRLYNNGTLAFETPIGNVSETPTQLLAKDPPTGIPRWTGASDVVTPLIPSILPNDTGDTPLPDATVVTTAATVPSTPVPSPTVDNCPQIRCGAAQMLAFKLVEQYTAIARMLNTFKDAAVFVKIMSLSGLAQGGQGEAAFLKYLKAWLETQNVPEEYKRILHFLEGAVDSGLFPALIAGIPMLNDAQQQTIWQHAYESLTCSEGIFRLTQTMKQAWQDRMLLDTTTYPDDIMRHLLGWCIQLSPFYVYDLSAASGAQHPRSDCGVWD